PSVKSAHDKLGSDDADRLAEAKADGEKTVTMMVATAPGDTAEVAKKLDAVQGGTVGRTYDELGYVRATVPTAKADAAIAAAVKLSSVHGIDLREEIALDDPTPSADTAKGAATGATATAAPAPGR
ncbi:serine protease, partial [Streptomyces sp. TRM76130]|nr:serine protease [Streptomyces sp. TRM76130]